MTDDGEEGYYPGHRLKAALRLRDNGGSVSLFLMLTLIFVFAFVAVLIDYARIAAFNAQGERLAHAAARSLLSAYDVPLQERYGLFAGSGSGSERLLADILNRNAYRSGRSDALNPVSFLPDSSQVLWERPLADYDVFRRQMEEEMKYKAPVDFVLELAGVFKPLASSMAEASRITEIYGQMQPLYERREAALDRMLEKRRNSGESIRGVSELIDGGVAETIAGHSAYASMYEADLYRPEDEAPRYTWQISAYLQRSAQTVAQLQTSIKQAESRHREWINEAQTAVEEAREVNEQMRVLAAQAENLPEPSGYAGAESWDIPESEGGTETDALNRLRSNARQLVMEEKQFREFHEEMQLQNESFAAALSLCDELSASLADYGNPTANMSRANTAVSRAGAAVQLHLRRYGKNGEHLAAASARLEKSRSADKKRKEDEKQAEAELGKAADLLEMVGSAGAESEASKEKMSLLRAYADDIRSFNEGQLDSRNVMSRSGNPYEAGRSSSIDIDGLYKAIGEIMKGFRGRLFQAEYAALYFPPFDPKQLQGLAGNNGKGAEGKEIRALDTGGAELEYVLYGFNEGKLNIGAAFAEIFAMRLAIRTMEGFTEKSALGNPLAVVAAALLYGVQSALADMLQLIREGEVTLSKYVPAKLSYRDHLRLFLLAHGGGEGQLARMLALIRLHTGSDPAERKVYVSAEITLGLKLWFLPGIIKLMEGGNGERGVEDGVYRKLFKADYAY